MILNAFAILAILVALIEFVSGGVLIVVVARGVRESHRQLLVLLVLLLVLLAGVGSLLWVLLLQSYVPQWSGVRCVAGVLRIGTGSTGATGWLPTLAWTTSVLRAALVFAAGACLVLHRAGRDQAEGPPSRRHLATLLILGVLAVAGAAVQTAYIVIPKVGQYLAAGCCNTSPGMLIAPVVAPLAAGAARNRAVLLGLLAAAVAVLLTAEARRPGRPGALRRVLAFAGSALLLVLGVLYLNDVAAPRALGLPLHRCLYCLLAEAPESLGVAVLLATPFFATGWRLLAGGPGRSLRTAALVGLLGGTLLVLTLPVLSPVLHGRGGPTCAVDGVALEDAPVVKFEEEDGESRAFCCIGCAMRWIRTTGEAPVRILVTDETTGLPIDARGAWFVRSTVVAQPATRDRMHAFASNEEAARHALAYQGRSHMGSLHPFFRTDE